MSRIKAREHCFKLLYQIDIHKGDCDGVIDVFFGENEIEESDKEYILKVVNGSLEEKGRIDSLIDENSKDWKMGRISKVTLAILRVAIFEILKMEDIPVSVSINEAVELSKRYDNEKSGAFVNGILGTIQKKLL